MVQGIKDNGAKKIEKAYRQKKGPIAHFAGCNPAQELIATGVLRDSNVSGLNLMVENAQ